MNLILERLLQMKIELDEEQTTMRHLTESDFRLLDVLLDRTGNYQFEQIQMMVFHKKKERGL